MKVLISSKDQMLVFKYLQNVRIRRRVKSWGNGLHWRSHLEEQIEFAGKMYSSKRIKRLFGTLEQRYALCDTILKKIRDEYPVVDSRKVDDYYTHIISKPISWEMVVYIEYFVFALNSCLDIMAQILNIIYALGFKEESVNITQVYGRKHSKKGLKFKRDRFCRVLLGAWHEWINEFKYIRNQMTHYQLLDFGERQTEHTKERRAEFIPLTIAVINNVGEETTKDLPTYFEFCLKGYTTLRDEFYKVVASRIQHP